MKERPILFSAPMVRALLDGSKTQTRRAIRKQFSADAIPAEVSATTPEGWQTTGHSGLWWDDAGACLDDAIRCPYGIPGDRLWVREAWAHHPDYVDSACRATIYRAERGVENDVPRWKPSIHMPRWASRITLEIFSLRVERLNDITKADAMAEGIVPAGDGNGWQLADTRHYMGDPVRSYRSLWESINGPESWDLNPWVWIVEFKVVKP